MYRLLPDPEDNWVCAQEDGIPLGDMSSNSSRSSYDTTTTDSSSEDDDTARDLGVTNFANMFRAVSYGPVSAAESS